jgi:hypothetical protein
MYAGAGIAQYLLVNLRDDQVEIFRAPDVAAHRYLDATVARAGDRFPLVPFPGASLAVDDLLPRR